MLATRCYLIPSPCGCCSAARPWLRARRAGCPPPLQVYKRISVEFAVLVLGVEAHGPGSAAHTKLCLYMRNALDYIDKITLLSPDVYFKSMWVWAGHVCACVRSAASSSG